MKNRLKNVTFFCIIIVFHLKPTTLVYLFLEFQGFHCPQNGCNSLYSTHDMLVVHLLLRHKIIVTQARYNCPFCRRSCATETQFRTHKLTCSRRDNPLEINIKEYSHKCNVCGKGFKTEHLLKLHMKVHTGERPYVCDICGKGFTQPGNLTAHVRYHTGEKTIQMYSL